MTRNVNFRILEFQSCSTGVEFEQYYSLVAVDDDDDDDDDDNVFLTMHGAIGELALQTIKHILHSSLL